MSGPAENSYDVIVIGAGPVGYTVAGRARAAGLSVAAVERELVGGACSYWAAHPLDEAVSAGQHYLYVLADGLSQIVGYLVGAHGSLTQVTTAPAAAGSGGLSAS